VKVVASVDGAGISVIGEGTTWATLAAKGAESHLRLKQKDGAEQVIKQ
jgi:hypothetical protein